MPLQGSPLEQWLSDATRGLSGESAARVRTEIQEHYDSTCEAGGNAIAALGDPRQANRAYRKVLLTEQEAIMAPFLTQPRRPSLQRILLSFALLAVALQWLARRHHGAEFRPITIAVLCPLPLLLFFSQTTIERTRISLYVQGLRNIVVMGISGWYEGWIGALTMGAVLFSLDYFFSYRRLLLFRKLAAGQTWSLLPEEPRLTHLEAIHLRTLRQGAPYENVSIAVVFLMLFAMAIWQPASFLPMTVWMAAGFLARQILPIYTEERSRWFRIANWTAMAIAGVLPVLYGARIRWIGAAELAFFFFIFDMKGISLRRKLPAAQWPRRLYW